MTLELPHTSGCLVCGRDNPHGLHLSSFVDPETGVVTTTFTPAPHHIGFESVIHGGVLATVVDELMVWAAIWASQKAVRGGGIVDAIHPKSISGATPSRGCKNYPSSLPAHRNLRRDVR